MRKLSTVLCLALLACTGLAPVAGAAKKTDLLLEILPLACSFDTTAVGHLTSQQLTPETCRDIPGEVLQPILPVATDEAGEASNSTPTPLPVASAESDAPLGIGTVKTPKDDPALQVSGASASQQEPSNEPAPPIWQPVMLAVAVVAFSIVPGSTLAPIVAQAHSIRVRISWFK